MKAFWQSNLVVIGAYVVACLVFAACSKTGLSKKISPEAAKESRLDWNLKTTVGAYQEIGNTDPKWDEAATNALAEFAKSRSQSFAPDEDWTTIIRTNCDTAVQAGCDDPLIRYLYIRFCMSQTNGPQDFAKAFYGVAHDIQKSSYPNIRKFYAVVRAVDQFEFAYGTNGFSMPEARELEPLVGQNLMPIIQDKTTPPEEVYEVCDNGLRGFNWNNDGYIQAYSVIEPPLFSNWPDESTSWLLKGKSYIQMGWNARGGGYANTVTEEGAKTFAADLAIAESALNHAWKLNPKDSRIPLQMMAVELGQGEGRDRMELWFDRAMNLDSNDYEACSSKLFYLEPKWYGTAEDMLDFGRECVQSTNWGGYAPITLVDAHIAICNEYTDESERTNYWKQPDVWPDIKAAYDRFFELNPKATDIYKNYAWYAYRAEQWDAFNEIAPKVRPEDYNFFGGKDEFNKMVHLAKEHASPPTAAPPPL